MRADGERTIAGGPVDDTPLYEIARRDYRQVDCTIDHANARATAARAALIDDGKKNLCSRRTRRCVFAAARQDFFIFPNFRLDIYPFVPDTAVRRRRVRPRPATRKPK